VAFEIAHILAERGQPMLSARAPASGNGDVASPEKAFALSGGSTAGADQPIASRDESIASRDESIASRDESIASRDESIASLGVIDTWAPGFPDKLPFAPRMVVHLKKLLSRETGGGMSHWRACMTNFHGRVMRKVRRFQRAISPAASALPDAEKAMNDVLELAELSLKHYQPAPLNRHVDYYRVDHQPVGWTGCSFEDAHNGWRPFVRGELNLVRLPCEHDQVFDDAGVTPLAKAVIEQLKAGDAALASK
jgi:thioesterase domain-containing protein